MSVTQATRPGGAAPRRSGALAGYGVALIVAATVLVMAEPRGSAWSGYGLLCEALGIGCLVGAGQDRFRRALPGLRRFLARAAVSGRDRRSAAPAAARVQPRVAGLGTTQGRVIRSEWTKFVSLRSSRIGPTLAVVTIVGVAMIVAATVEARFGWPGAPPFDPGVDLLAGVELAPLAVGVLGVLVITGDYATGVIRSAMTVVPTRMPLLWAKLAVVVGVVGAIALFSTPVAVIIGVAELRVKSWAVDPADPRIWAAGGWAALYMVLVGVIGLGLGTLLRSTAAAINVLVVVFFGVPMLVHLLPEAGSRWVGPYLPAEAGEAIWANPHSWHITSRPAALMVTAAWAAVLFAAASWRLLRDDA